MESKTSSERLLEAMEREHLHWLAKRQSQAAQPPSRVPAAFTIALSREAGTDAALIAHKVGKRLGWPVYDQELLRRIADKMDLRVNLLERVDEKRSDWFSECLEALNSTPSVSGNAYVHHLVKTLVSLASHGECVIVGRGAAQILPENTTLRVRLVGSLESRIAAIRQRFNMSRAEAEAWIEKTDRERLHFVKERFHRDPTDLCHYDLVLNAPRFSPEGCAELIIQALPCLQARTEARALNES